MAEVILTHLDKKYGGGFHAVRDVSLEIADGEFIVLVGPSGCGKSTTLRMIAGLEEITSGEIQIDGRTVNDVAPGDRDIAMVFQNYALYPHMSVYENMAFGLKMRRRPRPEIDRLVHEAAELLSIGSLLQRRPRELSGGQRQRVALGRAIVREPKVFLFDEPLSNLDAKLRVQMRTEIAQLHRRLNATIIYVTHDQVEAMTLGDRIVLMNHGAVQQVDTPLNIYNRPANQFVGSFVGSPAMNFFSGRLADGMFHITGANGEARSAGVPVGGGLPVGPAVLGVRPEDLVCHDDGPLLGEVTLEVVEHMGHETMVYFELLGNRHVARLPAGSQVKAGDRLRLFVRPEGSHLFAEEDGRRLN